MVNTPSPIEGTSAPSLTLTLLLVACIVVTVFYGGLFAIFAIWTSSARWRHDMQVFIGLAADRLLRAVSQSVAWVLSRRPRGVRSRPRLGDISPANSAMTLLEVREVDVPTDSAQRTRADLPSASSLTSAFPLYTPPTTLPMPAITSTLIENRPPSTPATPCTQPSAYERDEATGCLFYRPRAGYAPPEWPPKPKQPHARTYRYILASGIIVDLEKMIRVQPALLPWYADN